MAPKSALNSGTNLNGTSPYRSNSAIQVQGSTAVMNSQPAPKRRQWIDPNNITNFYSKDAVPGFVSSTASNTTFHRNINSRLLSMSHSPSQPTQPEASNQASTQLPIIPRRLSGKASVLNPTSITMSPFRSKDTRRIVSAPNSPSKASLFKIKSALARTSNDNDGSPLALLDDSGRVKGDDLEPRPLEPPSPTSSSHSNDIPPGAPKRALSFSHLASVFTKLRRAERHAKSHGRSRSWTLTYTSKAKSHHIESSSGPTPLTHPALEPSSASSSVFTNTTSVSGATASSKAPTDITQSTNGESMDGSATNSDTVSQISSQRSSQTLKARVEVDDLFVCADGVDVAKLLRASRSSLLQRAAMVKANALVEETWTCTICGPKHRSDGSFRVTVHYSAFAAHSPRPDPRQPVALSRAKGVPGLMTILNRQLLNLKTEPLPPSAPLTLNAKEKDEKVEKETKDVTTNADVNLGDDNTANVKGNTRKEDN